MSIKKLFIIAIKDLILIFRDTTALILMLLAPFILSVGMGALTGRFTGGGAIGISGIPVAIVNQDHGILGEILIEIMESPDLEKLLSPVIVEDFAAAKTTVDADQRAAAILIPAGFSDSIFSDSIFFDSIKGGMFEETAEADAVITIYANPTRPTSVNIIRSIVDQFVAQVEVGRVSAAVIVPQLLQTGIISPEEAPEMGSEIVWDMTQGFGTSASIQVRKDQAEGEALDFDVLGVMAPGMATMFLMFTVSYGARSFFLEKRAGTLPRMLISPTHAYSVLGGKFTGILLTAIAQLVILIGGTSLMFRLQWGDEVGVALLIMAAAFGATGWGILFAAILRTPGQLAITGSAVMLLFGLLGGSFFQIDMLPGWLQTLSRITPNSWANEGFYILSLGGRLTDIHSNLIALLVMGLVLFVVASWMINKRGLVGE